MIAQATFGAEKERDPTEKSAEFFTLRLAQTPNPETARMVRTVETR